MRLPFGQRFLLDLDGDNSLFGEGVGVLSLGGVGVLSLGGVGVLALGVRVLSLGGVGVFALGGVGDGVFTLLTLLATDHNIFCNEFSINSRVNAICANSKLFNAIFLHLLSFAFAHAICSNKFDKSARIGK